MRKLILLLALGLPAFAAFNSTMQLDVRTTGADTNSGGFDPGVVSPGTDESQQNTGTAMTVVASGTTAVSTPAFSATTHGPGNTLIVTGGSGCNTGTFEELSQSGGTATFDSSLGTGTCTAVMGGSKITNAAALALVVSGNTLNTQAGTYTVTSTLVTPSVSQFLWIGYQTTHADGGTKPLITTATNSVDLIDAGTSSGGVVAFDNLSLSNTAVTPANGIVKTSNNGEGVVRNCKLSGFTDGINGDNQGSHYYFPFLHVSATEIAASTTTGIVNEASVYVEAGSYIHGSGASYGIRTTSTNAATIVVSKSVIDSNNYCIVSVFDIVLTDSVVSNCAIVGAQNVNGQTIFSATGTIFYNDAIGAENTTSGNFNVGAYANNAYGSNTTNTANLYIPASASANDVNLSSCNPFVSSSNFALSACGLAALAGKGYPGTAPFGAGSATIGPVQAASSTAGNSSAYVQ